MNLLISGMTGLLGSAIAKVAVSRGHHCRALNREGVAFSLQPSAVSALDACFEGIDYFVHAAANTGVEACELDLLACYRDNVLLTELVSTAARRRHIPMSFISSTGVYGAHKSTPWAEFDEPRPETQHHRSKRVAESLVQAAAWRNLVVRTGWLFGGDPHASKNFVARRIVEARAAQDGVICSNQQQRGNPTFVDDAAARLLDLIALQANGVFNVVNAGPASRFEYVCKIVQMAGLDVRVKPVEARDFKRVAPVSDNETAINWRADSLGLPPMRSWEDALRDYLATKPVRAWLP